MILSAKQQYPYVFQGDNPIDSSVKSKKAFIIASAMRGGKANCRRASFFQVILHPRGGLGRR
jgi:hypothetical protein